MSRTENGSTVETEKGSFVAADLIAKLAGVSLGTVAKVMAAQDAIEIVFELEGWELIDFESVPTALPDAERATATNAAFEHIVEEYNRAFSTISADQWEKIKI